MSNLDLISAKFSQHEFTEEKLDEDIFNLDVDLKVNLNLLRIEIDQVKVEMIK